MLVVILATIAINVAFLSAQADDDVHGTISTKPTALAATLAMPERSTSVTAKMQMTPQGQHNDSADDNEDRGGPANAEIDVDVDVDLETYKAEDERHRDNLVATMSKATPLSLQEGRERIIAIFADAGVVLDNATLQSLPTWDDIVHNIGDAPRIYGLQHCERYRASIPPVQRNVACCGMFNSGTNLVMRLLKENCKIPERIDYYGWNGTFEAWGMGPADAHGMRWQVPWGKHTAAKYRNDHTTKRAAQIVKETVLPVVTIRHPYVWMKSMCKNSYTAKWPRGKRGNLCPHLVWDATSMTPTNLTVQYGNYEDVFDSLAHLWNGWYHQYWKEADYPFLLVRFEDLIFHAKNVTTQICHCAGGTIRTDRPFFYIVESAKAGPGHGRKEDRTGMIQAWIRYGNALPVRGGFGKLDYKAARKFLDRELMDTFGYQHPPPVG
jgi:hypothetical protein